MENNTRRDKVGNEHIRVKVNINPLKRRFDKIAYSGLVMCDVNLKSTSSMSRIY